MLRLKLKKRKFNHTALINNSTNMSKANNYLSPQIIGNKQNYDILRWKSRFWLGTCTHM